MGRRQVKLRADGEDRISNLPNNLLTRIMLCLPTKDAVKTSVLSTIWKPLWTSVPILDFRDSDFLPKGDRLIDRTRRKANFITFTSQILMQNNQCPLRKLCLECLQCYDLSVIESWISLAKERKVQELQLKIYFYQDQDRMPSIESRMLLLLSIQDLDVVVRNEKNSARTRKLCLTSHGYHDYSVLESWTVLAKEWNIEELELNFSAREEEFFERTMEFPKTWFTWDTLVVLKLLGDKMVLDFPPSLLIYFPKLKVLHLWDIIYKDGESANELICCSCPLEELEIKRCDGDNMENFRINSDTLKRLTVIFRPEDDGFHATSSTQLGCPALEYLNIEDECTAEYSVEDDFGALVEEANLDVMTTYFSDLLNKTSCAAFDLLSSIHNVMCLALSDRTILALQKSDSFDLPVFHLLTSLTISRSSACKEAISWKLILELLKRSPKLEALLLEEQKFWLSEEEDIMTSAEDVPECLGSQLEQIEFRSYWFDEADLSVVGYFLKSCRVLKELNIILECTDNPTEKATTDLVFTLPRASSECHINIGG